MNSQTQEHESVATLTVTDLRVDRGAGGREVSIVDGIDLTIAPGEAVAIVGESGSGKSVTARAVIDLLPSGLRASGSVRLAGRPVGGADGTRMKDLRGSRIAMVMQDPFTSLNPVQRVGDIICASLRDERGRRLSRRRRREEACARLAEVGIDDPAVAEAYPFELSGGMRQRVGIAAAIATEPDVLIADEPTTALDVTTQAEILALLERLRVTHRMALLLITHDLRVAGTVCDRVYVMYAGEVVEELPAADLLTRARHPYTVRLTQADPPLDHRLVELPSIPGAVPPPGYRSPGCRFATRCTLAVEACVRGPVGLDPRVEGDLTHRVRCVRAREALVLGGVEDSPQTLDPVEGSGQLVVRARGLVKRYASKLAVDGVDLDVRVGESVGIVGESGSGKTSLARMLLGLEPISSGELTVAGVELRAGADIRRDDWQALRASVQMAFQDPSSTLNPARTVGGTLQEVLSHAGVTGRHARRSRAEDLMRLVGLDSGYLRRRPAQMSGGERQRVAIARALARAPQVLVCDEVVSALDVSVQALVLNLLNRLRAELGLSYVFITHDLAVVRQIADRVYVMRAGRVVESGPTEQVLSAPSHPYTRTLVASVPGADPFTSHVGQTGTERHHR